MSYASSIVQRNLLVLEFRVPTYYKGMVYTFMHKYTTMSFEELSVEFEKVVHLAHKKGIELNEESLEHFKNSEDWDSIEILAKINAIATLISLHSVEFQKPIEWWRNITLQLIDVNNPMSRTFH